jgi:arylsulfatase A-like enzyme/Tfp pilus assembly protein PilF
LVPGPWFLVRPRSRVRPRSWVLGPCLAACCFAFCARDVRPPRATNASIVVLTIDTLRADRVKADLTPALAALARESVVFEQAVTVAPLTLPSHASLFTASYPTRHGVHDNHVSSLREDTPTYPARLKQRGYATAAFVSSVVLERRYGLNRGFDVYDDEIQGPERSGADTMARATQWIEGARPPFFVWIHLFEPHAPYRTGTYDGEVRAADAAADRLFQFLRTKNLWKDTIVSVTSDHGESLGEHGEQTHGFFVYDATMRIPWILKGPGLAARRFAPLVRIVDQLPTIVEIAGAGDAPTANQSPRDADGVSLVRSLASGNSPQLEAYGETFLPRDQFGWSELRMVRTETSKYIDAPRPEFYDLTTDPGEGTSVVQVRAAEADRVKRTLDAIVRLSAPDAPRVRSDPQMTEQLMSLGYIGGAPLANGSGAALPDPKDKLPVYNLTMAALELSEQGNIEAALGKLSDAERLDASVAQVAFLKGTLFGRAGQFDKAAAALERTLTLNPEFLPARFKLALAQLRLGQHDRATATLEHVVAEQPDDFRAWHNLAAIAYSRQDLDRAEQLEKKALAINKDYAEAWNTLGAIYIVRKQTEAAVDALTTATRLSPGNGQAYRNLSLALAAAGQTDRARAAAATACSIGPQYCTSGAPR